MASAIDDVDANVIKGVTKMSELIEGRGYATLRIDSHIFENETHTSVVPAVLTRGLRMVYGR